MSSLTQKKDIDRLTTESASSLTQKKDIDRLTTESASSLTQKKDIDRLTKVNKITHPAPPDCYRGREDDAGGEVARETADKINGKL